MIRKILIKTKLFIFLILNFVFLNSGNVFAEILSDEELLSKHFDFYNMMRGIFSLDNFDSQNVDLFNVKTTMGAITDSMLNAINEWSNTSLYKIFIGIGIFLLFVSFIMSFYQNSLYNENKTMEQYTKMILQLILAFFIIANVLNIASIIVNIFIFVCEQAWSLFRDENNTGMENTVREITLYLMKSHNLHDTGLIDGFWNQIPVMILYLHYLIPWICSIIGKFGLIFAVIKCAYNIFINVMLYPIAAFDCFDNIKHSNFMKYTKNIASSSLQLTIIVLVIYANNMLLSSYMNDMMSQLDNNNVFNFAVMSVVFQLVRMTMASASADSISKQVFGG